MDCCLSCAKPRFPSLPRGALSRPITVGLSVGRRPLVVSASTSSTSRREYGGLNAPLEPRTPAGKFLTGVLLDDGDNFPAAARKELERLARERDETTARLQLSLGSDEACLHRRIAEFKKQEYQDSVEDIMYTNIIHKFHELRVHMVPRLSKCLYNNRLEIWPSKDYELESIHSPEALQMVREHLTAVIGYKANSNITDTWQVTDIQRLRLCKLYAGSILYGYFLKSASLRHKMERVLNPRSAPVGVCSLLSGAEGSRALPPVGQVSYLRIYLMGFEPDMILMCARPKTKEAVNLIETHSCALFGDEETGLLESDDVITTSFGCLKRFLLEGVAFGSFLWEAENFVSDVFVFEEK